VTKWRPAQGGRGWRPALRPLPRSRRACAPPAGRCSSGGRGAAPSAGRGLEYPGARGISVADERSRHGRLRGLCRHGSLCCPPAAGAPPRPGAGPAWPAPSAGELRGSHGKSTKRRRGLTVPASSQGSVPAPPLATLLCLPAAQGKVALLRDPLFSSPKAELSPQSKTSAVPANMRSLQKQYCPVRTKQNSKATSPRTLKPPPSSSSVSHCPLLPLHPVSGLEPLSGGSQWLGTLSELTRSVLLIAETASRPREPPPELAAEPLVSSSAAGMLFGTKDVLQLSRTVSFTG